MMMGLILLSMCIVVYVAVSLATPAPSAEDLQRMGWQPPLAAIFEKRLVGVTDPRVVAIGLFTVMIVLYYILR